MDAVPTGPGADLPDLVRELEAVIGRRLDRLERENHRLRRSALWLGIGATAAFLVLAAVLLGFRAEQRPVAAVLEANRFVLRDDEGHVRAVLGLSAEGGSRLVLQDRDGRERLRVSLLSDGSPGMSFADRDGRSRAVLGFLPDETATLVFADRFGKTRAVFGLMPDESSTLVFADRDGETRVGLGIDSDGSAGLTVLEREPADTSQAAAEPSRDGARPRR